MTDAEFGITLGRHIIAARLRFGRLGNCNAYMRLEIRPDGLFRAEVCPVDSLPTNRGKAKGDQRYSLWYAPDSGLRPDMERLVARVLEGQARPRRIKKPVAFLFDDDGRFVAWD